MSRNLLTVFIVTGALVLPGASLFAHHSQSGEFDNSKPIEFTGAVKAVEWTNPHAYIRVEAKDASGKVSVYRVEIMAPNGLYRNGWRRTTVKPGTAVSFKGVQARNPESLNVSGRLSVDGKVVFQGQGPGDTSN